MKIAQIVGARPQFIKYYPVYRMILSLKGNIEDILIHTGQHYDYAMSEVFFNELGIKKPDYHLDVGSGSHGFQTGQIIERLEVVLLKERPDAVVVYGDTNSTLGGAIAAVKLHIPVIHVEAGLRSFNKLMPEEINRVLTDHASTILLCPTENAVKNLQREGFNNIVNSGKLVACDEDYLSYTADVSNPIVINVGDVMYDALLMAIEIASHKSSILEELGLKEKEYSLLTIHRAENTDNPAALKEIIEFVGNTSAGMPVIFPVHPRTRKVLDEGIKIPSNIRPIEPVGYFHMLWLAKQSSLIFTDSGGLQKEAYWLKVPCITLRDETEWVETVESGWNILYRNYKSPHLPQIHSDKLYGDGNASKRIVNLMTALIRR